METSYEFALGFVAHAHMHQRRKYTNEPYLNHLKEVAAYLRGISAPWRVVQAGLLHDIIEDTPISAGELSNYFNLQVVNLVIEVTDVSKPEDGNRAFRKAMDREHLKKTSPWGATIKLADMISNTQSIVEHDKNFAKVYLTEKAAVLPHLTHGDQRLFARAEQLLKKGMTELCLS